MINNLKVSALFDLALNNDNSNFSFHPELIKQASCPAKLSIKTDHRLKSNAQTITNSDLQNQINLAIENTQYKIQCVFKFDIIFFKL